MADLKLVGAVAIKLRPDATGFKKEAEAKLKKEAKDLSADVQLNVKADTTEAKSDVDKAKAEIEKKVINLRVGVDYDSIRRAQAQLDSAIKNHQSVDIKVDLNNAAEVKAALDDLESKLHDSKVDITYSQDEIGYREVLAKIDSIRRQKTQINIPFGIDEESLAKREAEIKALLDALKPTAKVTIAYDENRAGLEKAIADIDRELSKFHDVTIDVNADKATLLKAREEIAATLDHMPPAKVPFKIEWDDNRASIEAALAEVDRELAKHKQFTIDFNADKASLLFARDTIREQLSNMAIRVDISYNENKVGLEKAIAEIDAELARVSAVHIDLALNPLDLLFTKLRLEEELGQQTVRISYDENLASLEAAKAKIHELLGIGGKFHIDSTLDETSLLAALAEIDARIKEAEAANKVNVRTNVDPKDYFTTLLALKTLTKDQTVNIFTKVNDASLFLAAAKITGLRAASNWTKEFADTIGTLDRNLPVVAAAVTGISQLASGVLSLTSNIFSLGNGLGEVVRMGAVLAPTMILGLGASMIVLKGVFKDFGAAVNGDTKAMAKLAPAGKEAAKEIKPIFASIRETISQNFWDQASQSMLDFVHTALPAFGAGLGNLSRSFGDIFGTLLDSFTNLAKQGGLSVFFANMSHGFDVGKTGLSKFMDAFNTLAVVGSTVFPRMGRAFNDWADHFNSWIQGLAADGTLNRWIDQGIQGLKDLVGSGVSLIKIWGNIGQAAQAAGAMTLHSFAGALDKLDTMTAGARFQTNMRVLFEGAGQASGIFFKALGDLGPAMDVFSKTIKTTLVNSALALSSFIADIGDVLSSPHLGVGLTAFLTGVKAMFDALRPSAAYIVQILETMGKLMGSVATDTGPLFRNLFKNLADVFSAAYAALAPFLPGLIQVGTSIINVLGPVLRNMAQSIIPAFATAVKGIGEGITPIISGVGVLADLFAHLVAGLPIPVLAGLAGTILSIGTSLKFAATVVPLAAAAMEVFGISTAVSAARVQLMIPVVGIVLAAVSGLIAFGIGALATSQKSATPFANEYADALLQDAKAAGAVADQVGLATTQVAIKKLVDSGAYDQAKKLGIGTKELTDAVLIGGSAWDDVSKKINAANKEYDDNFAASQKANSGATDFGGTVASKLTPAMGEAHNAAQQLTKDIGENVDSLNKGKVENEANAEAAKAMGIETTGAAGAQKALATQTGKTAAAISAAAQASSVLNDSFASGASKVDAMRKTFQILLGADTKQQAAETLGAYVKGFNDLKDTVGPVAQDLRNLGDAAYGDNGFLNVANGNKAVLQVNQALVDEVNNVWSGAKTAYDAAIAQGHSAKEAFSDAQNFIADHHGDYNKLAEASGVAADKVQGQWDAVFGHDWVLKVSLEGATEAAAKAQALMASIKGNFDGQRFQAFLDANPDEAMKAITDANGAAKDFVDHEWQAKLKALPTEAQDQLRMLTGETEQEWNRGDFQSILRVAAGVPGLAQALVDIANGVNTDWRAVIFAITNKISVAEARAELDALAARRTANIDVIINRGTMPDLNGPASGNGRFGTEAIGAILDGMGRGLRGFAPIYKAFANGGIENHVAQIARPGVMPRVWAESETGGEAYLPLNPAKRVRSVAILKQVASMFGYQISKAQSFADGGTTVAPSNTSYHAPVHIGQLITTDPDAAVQALQQKRRDAMAVHNIRPF